MTIRDAAAIAAIRRRADALARPACIMEICGTHTMSIARAGLRALFPDNVSLISGPGCPVCVTDQAYIDAAVGLTAGTAGGLRPVVATYGDMVRVPGLGGSLGEARAAGAAVEVVYSADQAVEIARQRPGKEVVFLAVGFETTTPATALAVLRAQAEGVTNFSVFTAHKLVMPALRALLSDDQSRVDAFLAPGHVSVILGSDAYAPLVAEFHKPFVVAGFEPGQILAGVAEALRQLAADEPVAASVYPSVTPGGNRAAQALLDRVFEPADAAWRGIGVIPGSGLVLRPEFHAWDAARKFGLKGEGSSVHAVRGCRCGDVIQGRMGPEACPLFARVCTPLSPVGPCMVSSEGACAAAFKYGRHAAGRKSA